VDGLLSPCELLVVQSETSRSVLTHLESSQRVFDCYFQSEMREHYDRSPEITRRASDCQYEKPQTPKTNTKVFKEPH